MYALFCEQLDGHLEWFCDADNEDRARAMARLSSKYGTRPVVVMGSNAEGRVRRIAMFRDGEAASTLH